jgi:uncharacterized protein
MITRIPNIEDSLEKNKVVIIYGPRQVGKTTLVKEFLKTTSLSYQYFTGDQLDFARDFGSCSLEIMKSIIGTSELLVIDEAQKIPNIGQALKLVVDTFEGIFVIVTGSSSFDLANVTGEPLTGRKNLITLYPISLRELGAQQTPYQLAREQDNFLIYGMYPNVLEYKGRRDKQNRLTEIVNSYLIADILAFQKVKSAKPVIDLLKLLAFQIGSEVSATELGGQLGMDHKTVLRYLDLLEKSFVLFRLDGFSRNLRKEVTKMSKYYFYDCGIRNALIANMNDMETRNDQGALWENFMIMERIKRNAYMGVHAQYYFWRTYDQQEIDFIEERGGMLHGYEMKWKAKGVAPPADWLTTYDNADYTVVTPKNFDFIFSK